MFLMLIHFSFLHYIFANSFCKNRSNALFSHNDKMKPLELRVSHKGHFLHDKLQNQLNDSLNKRYIRPNKSSKNAHFCE